MNEIESKILCLICSGAILMNAFAIKRVTGAWSAPGALYSLFWFFYTFVPLAVLPFTPANPFAILYILVSCVIFSLSARVRPWRMAWKLNELNARNIEANLKQYDNRFLFIVFFTSGAIATISLLIDQSIQGFTISSLTKDLLSVASQNISRRYAGDLVANVYGQIGNILSYVAVGLGGLLVGGVRGNLNRAIVVLSAFIPVVFQMAVQGAKGELFLGAAMFFAGTIVRSVRAGEKKLFGPRFLISIFLSTVVLFPILIISFVVRGFDLNQGIENLSRPILIQLSSYACGHLYAFSDWFTSLTTGNSLAIYSHEPMTLGFYTFMAPFRWFGDNRFVPIGTYDEYFSYGDYLKTNIFSSYRGLITDFGIAGSLLFMGIVGFISHEIYFNLITRKFPTGWVAAYLIVVGAIYMSFVISLWTFNGPFLTFFLLWAVLLANSKISRSRRTAGLHTNAGRLRSHAT